MMFLDKQSDVIGRIYRPTRVHTLHDKRGVSFKHKYKSNFGGTHKFTQDMFLLFDGETECVRVEITDLQIPVMLDASAYTLIDDQLAVSKKPRRAVESLREISRPGEKKMTSNGELLTAEMQIVSLEEKKKENEVLTLEMSLIRQGSEEYLWVSILAKTQVEIAVNTALKLQKR